MHTTEKIITHLSTQPDILACLLRRHVSLEPRILAWLTGDRRILLIGGEPGNGKSLLMGNLILQHRALAQLYPALRTPLALISYDRVHHLFLKRLMELKTPDQQDFLPEGETYLGARNLITRLLQDVLLFAIRHLAPNTLILLEAPLVGHRGEDLIDMFRAWGFGMQVFILYSPKMWRKLLMMQQLPERNFSAHALAMQQIHEALLKHRAIQCAKSAEEIELRESWEQWLARYDGLVLAWDPTEDQTNFLYTREILNTMKITPDPLSPEVLQRYTSYLIDLVLELYPDLDNLARSTLINK